GQEDAGGTTAACTAVQQVPGLALGIDRPVADNPGVEKVKALLARPVDLPVRLADEHRLTLMDGDLRWANVNLECHGGVLMVAREAPARPRERGASDIDGVNTGNLDGCLPAS